MIENLGNIGDLIGGVGVFVTLVYLATQVRQNTRSHRLASIQQIISTSVVSIHQCERVDWAYSSNFCQV